MIIEQHWKIFQVEDHELADVAAVSAGNDYAIGNMISDALRQVGRHGVVTIEKGNYAENSLEIVEGMKFDRGYLSPYFVTDRQKMTVEFHDCKVWNLVLIFYFVIFIKNRKWVLIFCGCSCYWLTRKSQIQGRCLRYWTMQSKKSTQFS